MNHKFKLGATVLYKDHLSSVILKTAIIVRVGKRFHPNLTPTNTYNKGAPYAVTFSKIIKDGSYRRSAWPRN